ncbi:hypothetical protein YC2023_015734 [Brassica napus]
MEKPIKYWLREKMDFDQASKGHVMAHIRSIFFTFQSPGRGYIKRQSKFQSKTLFSQNLSCFLVSHIQVNTSSNRWTCASYQATTRDPSLGGLVSHIKPHLKSGISEAFRNLRATIQSIQFSIRSSYPNRTSRHLSSLISFLQDFEEKKAPSITPIIMENQLCFDPGTTSTPFPINFQEHFKFLKHNQAVQTGYLGDASDRGSVQGEYLNIQKVFFHEFNFSRRPTQQGFTEACNYKKLFTKEKVMNFTNRRFHSPSICEYQTFEGDSSPMKKRPETKPIIGFKMDLPYFQKS